MGDGAVYFAKSANSFHGKITNRDHLERVRRLAGEFGEALGIGPEAALAGWLHDFGKYSERFQNVLRGREIQIDHALPGAAFLYAQTRGSHTCRPILEAIHGHHDGLVSLSDMGDSLKQAVEQVDWDACPSGKMSALRGRGEYQRAGQAFLRDFPEFRFPKLSPRPAAGPVADMLDTRMLFSCLVDADYSASAMDDDPSYLEKSTGPALNPDLALRRLLDYQGQIRRASASAPEVNEIRDRVFTSCGQAAPGPVGLFTLTAPTGVGKTLAMLNFALRHCQTHNLKRILVVLPFLSLAEQTKLVYENIFPEILVDHSQQVLTEQTRDLAARWAAPVIITTSVRFF